MIGCTCCAREKVIVIFIELIRESLCSYKSWCHVSALPFFLKRGWYGHSGTPALTRYTSSSPLRVGSRISVSAGADWQIILKTSSSVSTKTSKTLRSLPSIRNGPHWRMPQHYGKKRGVYGKTSSSIRGNSSNEWTGSLQMPQRWKRDYPQTRIASTNIVPCQGRLVLHADNWN